MLESMLQIYFQDKPSIAPLHADYWPRLKIPEVGIAMMCLLSVLPRLSPTFFDRQNQVALSSAAIVSAGTSSLSTLCFGFFTSSNTVEGL